MTFFYVVNLYDLLRTLGLEYYEIMVCLVSNNNQCGSKLRKIKFWQLVKLQLGTVSIFLSWITCLTHCWALGLVR